MQLTKFFECRGCSSPRELADDTINRVGRRLAEGEQIQPAALSGYLYGVARNVFREYLRNPETATLSIETLAPSQHPSQDPHAADEVAAARRKLERQLECLETCLEQLPPETRKLVVSYYDEGAAIEHRHLLAQSLGVTSEALRVRVHRIRRTLEQCVSDCLSRKPIAETESSFAH